MTLCFTTFLTTTLDSIGTLYIMDMKEEYETARKWIADEFKFDHTVIVKFSYFKLKTYM